MKPHTVINQHIDDAPAKRTLRGDKRRPDPGTHISEFPGGAIELARLDDGTYWVHIIVNRGQALPGVVDGLKSAHGEVVDSRIDWAERRLEDIPHLPEEANLTQLAVRIRPQLPEVSPL